MGGVVINSPAIRILGVSGAAATAPADTADNTLATISVPAGAMGPNGILRITTLWSHTNSANNKTLNVKFGGTSWLANIATTTSVTQNIVMIRNRGVTNSQVGFMATTFQSFVTAAASAVTASIDTTTAQSITITGQKASAGETITLESYLVELIVP